MNNRTQTPLSELEVFLDQEPWRARALPPVTYWDKDILNLEQDRIFSQDWVCIGRASRFSAVGDYQALEIAGEPLIVIRDREKKLRAFSNVCLHRMSTLLEGSGHCSHIVCPYHAWSYGLDGRLRGAPHMEAAEGFNPSSLCLPEFRLTEWEGFLFVSLNANAISLKEALRPLQEQATGHYQLGSYVETFYEEMVWQTNWKCLAENYMESYHLFQVHRNTVGRHSKTEELVCVEGGPFHNLHWIIKNDGFSTNAAHPTNKHLQGEWRNKTALYCVYPGLVSTLTPGYFWYLSVRPEAVDRVRVVYGGGLAPEFAAEQDAEQQSNALKTLLDKVNAEDRQVVEGVHRGLRARAAKAGRLHPLEQPVLEHSRYVARRLLGREL